MSDNLNGFVSLDRTFHDLTISEENGDQSRLRRILSHEPALRWSDLLKEPRVILLSEAGSGKTEEIRHTSRRLRTEGRTAFFLRIEHVVHDFESCFEEGTHEEFERWLASGEEGWLLLDSVDEARLKDPKDFERTVRKLGVLLHGVLHSTHVVITGRTDAWRPRTDLLLCNNALPLPPVNVAPERMEGPSQNKVTSVDTEHRSSTRGPFRIVALEDLQGDQIDRFAIAKGVVDIKAFRLAIERAEAQSFTTRPLDLAETVEFWTKHQRIGSRLELMRNSIAKRLEERDQDRSEARPITPEKVRKGAQLVAAAATLTQQSAIRVPDGHQNTKGLAINEVLTDWDDVDCGILLSRPIFDEGIYGTVRFHHRSVREYLTAEWLHSLIVDDASRAKIEQLFFRQQYGIEVIVPTMRPILPWLANLDQRMLDRVVRLAPEVLFEGGDPSQLPVDTRRTILRQTCEQLAQPAHGRSMMDYSAVQRFTNADLADDIGDLLDQYAGDDNIVWFLMRMIQQGAIAELADKARDIALKSRAEYTRVAAIRALIDVGTLAGATEVRQAIAKEPFPICRNSLAELVTGLPHDSGSLAWLLEALELADTKSRYTIDNLEDTLLQYAGELAPPMLRSLLEGLVNLLKREPVVERRHCEISQRYSWLCTIAGQAALLLIKTRDAAVITRTILTVLQLLPAAKDFGVDMSTALHEQLSSLVRGWPELNQALFWHCVETERARRESAKHGRLIDYWHVSISGAYWAFDASAFDLICNDLSIRPLLDDRLVALTLAFSVYREGGKPRKWRERLRALAADEDELRTTLDKLLNPPPREYAEWRRQEAARKRRVARRKVQEANDLEQAISILSGRLDALRDPGKPSIVTQDQYYLHERMQRADNQRSKWTDGNWQSLIETYGGPIAHAFRDGAVSFWRGNQPKLRSQGADDNSTPFSVIFGLTGLAIEARETPDWPVNLNERDAELATRYALYEMNGFPAWLPALYKAFPAQVTSVILNEIDHELASEKVDSEVYHTLSSAAWHGSWAWDSLAPALLAAVRARRVNLRNLEFLLSIVQGSSIDDETIAKIASKKATSIRNLTFSSAWFASWTGVHPDAAIPALAARLADVANPVDRTLLAQRFIVALLGGRTQASRVRRAYRTVTHMKSLYLLMTEYVREDEDIQRAGTGVYSPGLRDGAQDARDALLAFIRDTPGKDAFLALLDMARAHPEARSRSWMSFHAKNKAAIDADVAAWTPGQVREFNDALVSTPSNHRELWYFAVDRLEALKHELEDGDVSVASILLVVDKETEFRKFIGGWCRDHAAGRYSVPQEEELADAKRPDLRFLGNGFDAPVPVELKVADKWTGPHLFERLEVQLCGDYLRDAQSSRGIFALVYRGTRTHWELPGGGQADDFEALITALRHHWSAISNQFPRIEDIAIIGIDLTRRGGQAEASRRRAAAPKSKRKDV